MGARWFLSISRLASRFLFIVSSCRPVARANVTRGAWAWLRVWSTLVWGLLIAPAHVLAQEGPPHADRLPGQSQGASPSGSNEEAISIHADRMTIQGQEDRITFEGQVTLQKGDLLLQAETAQVYFTPTPPGKAARSSALLDPTSHPARTVSRIALSGGVNVRHGARRAKAQEGVYNQDEGRLTLTGTPEVWEAGYHVKGKTMTFFLREDRSLIEESQVILSPGK